MQTGYAWPPTGIWHPANGFDTLALHLFTGAAYARCMGYMMANRDIDDIGLCVIKRCGMYAEEYRAWIPREAERPRIVKTFNTFKMFWATKIMLVNQTVVPASMHGYSMAAVNDDNSVVLYGESIAKLWHRVCCHARIRQGPQLNDCVDARAAPSHVTVLHCAAAAAIPPSHLRTTAATAQPA
jgi:hypothetical protein